MTTTTTERPELLQVRTAIEVAAAAQTYAEQTAGAVTAARSALLAATAAHDHNAADAASERLIRAERAATAAADVSFDPEQSIVVCAALRGAWSILLDATKLQPVDPSTSEHHARLLPQVERFRLLLAQFTTDPAGNVALLPQLEHDGSKLLDQADHYRALVANTPDPPVIDPYAHPDPWIPRPANLRTARSW